MFQILIANGVNLDLLGRRPRNLYGERTLAELQGALMKEIPSLEQTLKAKVHLTFFQTNEEAAYLQKLSEKWDGALLNPGAWTHTSLALADRLEALQLPFVEVHISQLSRREDFRQVSFARKHAIGVVYGFGFDSYLLALYGLVRHLLTSEAVV